MQEKDRERGEKTDGLETVKRGRTGDMRVMRKSLVWVAHSVT